jgi:hypothetical protein
MAFSSIVTDVSFLALRANHNTQTMPAFSFFAGGARVFRVGQNLVSQETVA